MYTQQWYSHTDPARKLSANLYDIYHFCVHSEKLLMMNMRNYPKHVEFYSQNKFGTLVHCSSGPNKEM